MALAVSVRPHEPGAHEPLLDQLRAEPGVQVLKAAPLGDESVATVVRRRLPGAGEQACRAAAEATAGNPLYLAELLRAVTGESNGQKVNGDMAGSIQRAALPSLGDRVARRIARVADRAPELAAAMAVLGDGNTLALAAALAEMRRGDRRPGGRTPAPDRGPGRRGPVRVRAPAGPALGVRRPQHLRARQPAPRRRGTCWRGPGAARRWWPPTVPPSVPPGSVEAARAMTRAAAEAMARGAPDEAVRWYTRALEEEPRSRPGPSCWPPWATAEVALLDPAALDHLREALRESDDPALIARVAVTLAPALFASGRWTESADCGRRLRLQDPGNQRGHRPS